MELGSISKSFTSEVMYHLHKIGMIGLDQPVTNYIKNAPSSWNQITVRHLLDHTSGITNYLTHPAFRAATYFQGGGDSITIKFFNTVRPDSMEKLFYSLPLEFEAGSGWSYSNTGYYLLGQIAEAVTGRNIFDLAHELIFQPFEMKQTMANEIAFSEGCLAHGYFENADTLQAAYTLTNNYASSAGAWATTGIDMIQYLKAIHARVLPSDTMEDARTKHAGLPFTYSGGRFYSVFHGMEIITHNGGTPGYSSSWIYVPEKNISIIVMMNIQDNASIEPLAWDLLAGFEPALRYPSAKKNGKEEEDYTQLLLEFLTAMEKGSGLPGNMELPLKRFLESENGKELWSWYFNGGFPKKAYCVDSESYGDNKLYRFRMPLSTVKEYRITMEVNKNNKIVQLRWW